MNQRLIAPPTALPVTLDLAKANLRVDGADMDALITAWIMGVTAHAEHYTHRAIMTQQWRVTLDNFPGAVCNSRVFDHSRLDRYARDYRIDNFSGAPRFGNLASGIVLDNCPIASVQNVKYIDVNGAQQTLPNTEYLVDFVSEPGFIVPAVGKAWPTTARQINAVTADYTCGYGSTPADVPDSIKMFIIAKLVEQFDPAASTQRDLKHDTVQASFIDCMLDRYKVYG